jgi:hypothetical protein
MLKRSNECFSWASLPLLIFFLFFSSYRFFLKALKERKQENLKEREQRKNANYFSLGEKKKAAQKLQDTAQNAKKKTPRYWKQKKEKKDDSAKEEEKGEEKVGDEKKEEEGEEETEWKYCKTEVLVVDECSLVSVRLFATLLNILLENSNLWKIVLLGDYRQLPSIEPGNFLEHVFEVSSHFVTEHPPAL